MANLSITAANVIPSTGAIIDDITLGEAGTRGQVVYLDTTVIKWYLAINTVSLNGNNLHTYGIMRILMADGANNQKVTGCSAGIIFCGATVAVGVRYYLSATPGAICPVADVASGHEAFSIFYGITTSTVQVQFVDQGTLA